LGQKGFFKKLALNHPRLEELADQAAKKSVDWTTRNLDQCISLSLSDIKKNEPMLKVACFFWSTTYNAFLFRQGPMSPTLADVHMLIGLNIVGHINPFSLLVKPTAKLDSKKQGVGPNTLPITRLTANMCLTWNT